VGSVPKLSWEMMGPIEAAAVVLITLKLDLVTARRVPALSGKILVHHVWLSWYPSPLPLRPAN